jgi:hypothetical protein
LEGYDFKLRKKSLIMKKLYFYNNYHYGDCLVSLHFLDHLSKVNGIECEFACKSEYHDQLNELVSLNSRITLSCLPRENYDSLDFRTHSGPNNAINLWCCPSLRRMWGSEVEQFPAYSTKFPTMLDLGFVLLEIWKYVCQTNDLVFPFTHKDEMIFDQEVLLNDTLNSKYDFLLVNSYCHSGQMKITPEEQDNLFVQITDLLKENNKTFITTQKLLDYECTLDYNLSLVGIGQLSKHCKVVLGVPTAPLWISLNKWSMQNYIKFVNYTNDICAYDFGDKTVNINDLDELYEEVCNLIEQV